MGYITISELKSEYPTVDYSAYSDTTLQTIIERATAKVDDFCEQTFGLETITDEIAKAFIDADSSLVIFPRKKPIVSLTSVNLVKGSADVSISLVNGNNDFIYTIPEPKERIVFPIADITLQSVSLLDFGTLRTVEFYSKITYQAGYTTIPDIVKEATALFAIDTIARSSNITGAVSVSQGGISINYGSNSGGRSELVKDAERLLHGYTRVTGF